jgi:hypothetical protein
MELHAEDGFKAQAARKGMARRRKMDGNSRSLVASLTRDHGGSGAQERKPKQERSLGFARDDTSEKEKAKERRRA